METCHGLPPFLFWQVAEKAPSALSSSKLVIAAYRQSTPHFSLFDSSHLELFEQPA
jgi:hypothetical protein